MIESSIGLVLYFLFVLPVLGAAGFGAMQVILTQKGQLYPVILPALTGLAVWACAHQADCGDPWIALLWQLPLLWSRLAMAGTLAGWLAAVCRNKWKGWQVRRRSAPSAHL